MIIVPDGKSEYFTKAYNMFLMVAADNEGSKEVDMGNVANNEVCFCIIFLGFCSDS
jgi:hypothetical protein